MEDAECRRSITAELQDAKWTQSQYLCFIWTQRCLVILRWWPQTLHNFLDVMMHEPDTFLFLPCDGNAKVLNSTRTVINRHVQCSYRQKRTAPTTAAIALPFQIRFSTAPRRTRHPISKSKARRDTTDQYWQRPQSPSSLTLPAFTWTSSSEGFLHEYYINVVANHLFCSKTSHFWETYVLQACQQLAVVKEALLALSGAFSDSQAAIGQAHLPRRATADAQTACLKAVGMLQAYMQHETRPSSAVVLTCAILLYAQAKVLGDHEAVATHLNQAISIFDKWASTLDESNTSAEFRTIRTTLLLLDLNASLEDITRPPKLQCIGTQRAQFESLEDMLHGYSVVGRNMMAFTINNYKDVMKGRDQCPTHIVETRDAVAKDLEQWRLSVDDFVADRHAQGLVFTPREQECFSSIMLQYLAGRCQIAHVLSADERTTSAWDDLSQEVLSHGSCILQIRQAALNGHDIGKRRSLIMTYAQSLGIFAGAMTGRAQKEAFAMVAQAQKYEHLIRSIDMSHVSSGKGLEHALFALEQDGLPPNRCFNLHPDSRCILPE